MYLIPALVAAALAALFYVPDFLDTPIGSLTVRELVSQLLFVGAVFVALAALARSVERDSVWPWHRLGLGRARDPRRR